MIWRLAVFAFAATVGGVTAAAPTLSPVRLAPDPRGQLEALAHDSMQGRMTGTAGHQRATTYLAAELRRIGVHPLGDSGTYFQRVPIRRTQLDLSNAELRIGHFSGRGRAPRKEGR